ncbi:MAG: hypothetical protein FJ167_02610 [Gammaproteobacteria bacterium]|nr:hypothetical protein [Gammaproteobacteria bacterium]
MHGARHNIFLHRHRVFELPLSVKKLPKPRHLVINYFPLRLQLGFENTIPVLIAHDRDWALAKRIDVNAETIANV